MPVSPYAWAGAALLLLAASATAQASDHAGDVLAVSGNCFVEIAGQRSALKPQDPIHVGDTLVIADGAKLQMRMLDGSVVTAAAGTRMTVGPYAIDAATGKRDAQFSLWQGLLRAIVSKVSQPSRFEVDTATAVAAVRSTDWFVEATPSHSQIGVLNGHVMVEGTATGRSVEIVDGQGTDVKRGASPTKPRPWAKREFDEYIARTRID